MAYPNHMIDEAANQKSIANNTRTLVLIIFSVICWSILWNALWHLFAWDILHFSKESFLLNLQFIFSLPPEKSEVLKDAWTKGIRGDFFIPHLFIAIANFFLVPFGVGFYIGRHSNKNSFLNCFLVIALVMLFRPVLDLLSNRDLSSFLWVIFLKGYFLAPVFFFITSVGAFIGNFKPYHGQNALYLELYRDLLNKHRKGIIFLVLAFVFIALQVDSIEKKVEEVLSPYFKYAYAPVTFNSHPKDYPLLRISKSSKDDPLNLPKLTSLNSGDDLALFIYINNNSYLYGAVNTKLSLRQTDQHHFTAILWADNAKPIQKTVEIPHNCTKPVFSYLTSSWYSVLSKSGQPMPIPSGQTGKEILERSGINLGEIPGIWAGTSNFITVLKYECSD